MAAKTLTPAERETVILLNDEEDMMYVMTFQRKIITKLKKNPSATIIGEGFFGNHRWVKFELPAELLSFRTGTYKRNDLKGKPVGV